LVHSAVCNEGRISLDGIENGGLRLANEINDVIRGVAIDKKIQNRKQQNKESGIATTCIALSIIGNSMGGLYGRYALKYINWTFQVDVGGLSTAAAAADVVDVLVSS
jgi:hypothetical protein